MQSRNVITQKHSLTNELSTLAAVKANYKTNENNVFFLFVIYRVSFACEETGQQKYLNCAQEILLLVNFYCSYKFFA